jgi:ubiquinone/menaquinone biosynthesis C-methylase UbiE
LVFLTLAAVPSESDDRTALEQAIARAEAARDWPAAIDAAKRLNDVVESDHVASLYRLARLHALSGQRAEAYEYLERMHQAGLWNAFEIRRDEAFAALREEERFRELVRRVRFKAYLWLLERPERDAYQMPERVLQTLALRAGERVADVGAGSGYFTRRVSRAVGPDGVVWAIDVDAELLAWLEQRARAEGLTNIRIRRVEKDDPQLPPAGVDTILMVDTLHYIPAAERGAYARKLRAALAPGGRVVIIDFLPKTPEERPWGPPPSQKMAREEVDAAMAEAGLSPVRVHEFLTEQFFVEYEPAD